MELTDEELEELFDVLYDYVFYGEDEIVYTERGDVARSILRRVEDEIKARRLR